MRVKAPVGSVAASSVRSARRPPTVLLVDDDPSVRSALGLVFEDDYDFVTCASGAEGLAKMSASVHAVLLDIKLHGEDGFAVYERIRARFSYTPIIFYSAYQNLKDPHQIINEYRPFGYVRKGDDIAQLVRMVGRAVAEYAYHLQREAQLRIADRLAVAGTLAAGAAHEINNPLGYIVGNLELALEQVGELKELLLRHDAEAQAELELALTSSLEGAHRIAAIVNDLRSFGKPPEPNDKDDADLHHALDVAARMAGNQIRHRARLVTEYGEVPRVRADQQRLVQIFLNLLVNATQALRPEQAERNVIGVRTFARGQHGIVEIRDTGSGIPQEVRSRIFDPFFTTKPVNIGTGLGLFVTHNLVEALGGTIELVESSPAGTTFHVALPLSTVAPSLESPSSAAHVSTERGSQRRQRVLVVDDDPMIRAVIRRQLRARHDVVLAEGGRAATDLCQRESFDVILCDLLMPEVSGVRVYQAIREHSPGLERRIVFMTGGVFDPDVAEFLDGVENVCLDKPIRREVLLSLLDDVASTSSAGSMHTAR
ncbi:MAG: response regulator [Myxococcota bacterium]